MPSSYGSVTATASVRGPGAHNRQLLSAVLATLAVVAILAVVWLGQVDTSTVLAEYDPEGIADTYKSDATEKDSYIVVECWGGDLKVPVEDSEPCQQKMKKLESGHKYKSAKKAGKRSKSH